MLRKSLIALVLSCALFAAGCSPNLATGFKIGLAASKPFVQSLVTSGVLTQGAADTATHDLGDGIDSATRGQNCLKLAKTSATGPARRVANGRCYFTLAQELRVILARHGFAGAPQLDQIATIVQGAIEAFEAYNQAVVSSPPATRGRVRLGGSVTAAGEGVINSPVDEATGKEADKQLNATLEDLNKNLKALKAK